MQNAYKKPFFDIKRAVIPIIIINIVVFILQNILGSGFTNLFSLSGNVFARPWILLTHMFLHSNFTHILFNMYVLLMFGSLLEQRIGAKRFLLVYLVSGIVAGFFSSFFYTNALGASGAIMGVLGVLIILMPNLRLLLFFMIPMPLWIAAIFMAIIDAVLIFVPSNIGSIAHLIGLACGLLFGLWLRQKKQKFYAKKFVRKNHLDNEDIDEYLKSGRI